MCQESDKPHGRSHLFALGQSSRFRSNVVKSCKSTVKSKSLFLSLFVTVCSVSFAINHPLSHHLDLLSCDVWARIPVSLELWEVAKLGLIDSCSQLPKPPFLMFFVTFFSFVSLSLSLSYSTHMNSGKKMEKAWMAGCWWKLSWFEKLRRPETFRANCQDLLVQYCTTKGY